MKRLFPFAVLFFITTFTAVIYAQTININISGVVIDSGNVNHKLAAHLTFQQYVNPGWVLRGETDADNNGEFSANLDNVTEVEGTTAKSPYAYKLDNNVLISTDNVAAEITYFDILGRQIGGVIKTKLFSGKNYLKDNALTSLSNGVYIKRITIEGNILTQKINKTRGKLNYGSAGITNLITQKKITNSSSGKETHLGKSLTGFIPSADSVYLMMISDYDSFRTDTTITAISKTNPEDQIINPSLVREFYDVSMFVKNFLHEVEPYIRVYARNDLGVEVYFTSLDNGRLDLVLPVGFGSSVKMWFTSPFKDADQYINFQAIQDSVNFGKRNLFNPATKDTVDVQGYPYKKILNYMLVDLDTLQERADRGASLQYKILNRFSETNTTFLFPDGKYDLNKVSNISIFANAGSFMRKMDANIVDTIFVITSDQVYHRETVTNNRITSLDSSSRKYWLDEFKN